VQFRDLMSGGETPRYVDLAEANRRQLIAAGLPAGAIETSGLCTRCDSELESFRRDGEASGRMVAAAGLRNEANSKT
jgi:copper oxidase (laccase) domain-containing protein